MSLVIGSGSSKLLLVTAVELANTYLARDHSDEAVIVSDAVPPYLAFSDVISASTGWRKADGTPITTDPALGATFTMTQLAATNRVYQRSATTGGSASKGSGAIPVTINATKTGIVRSRLRSSDGTTILGAADTITVSDTGAQVINVTGVAARLGWFYLDLSSDGVTWQNGTTAVGMGRIVAAAGQSQAVRLFGRMEPNSSQTISNQGLTINPNGVVFARYDDDSRSSATTPVWALPAENTDYDACGSVEFLNREVALHGVNVAFTGYTHGGTKIASWQPGQQNHTNLLTILDAIGGFEAFYWHLGTTDGQYSTPYADYKAGLQTVMASLPAHNLVLGDGFQKVMTAFGILATGDAIAPLMVMRKAVKDTSAGLTNSLYVEPHDFRTGDQVHETAGLGATQLADSTHRAFNAQRAGRSTIGPIITGGSRASGSDTIVLNVAHVTGGTNLITNGDYVHTKFQVYPTGTAPNNANTGRILGTIATVTANTITLKLESAPAANVALDVHWCVQAAQSNDGDGNMIRDDYTADGITFGRVLEPTTSAPIAIAAA